MRIMSYVISPEFRIPTSPQELIGDYQSQPPVTQEPLDWNNLIPHRKEEPELMTVTNPFMNSVVIADKRMRSVYDAIDNRRSVKHLCYVTGMSVKDVLSALQSLVDKNRVELYDEEKKPVDSKQFLINQQS